ncbi:MAG: hypothetical protein H7175_13845 [Burkholderiales bacterium]|nr:hypothetical protein [Anaerolineae bacterium]
MNETDKVFGLITRPTWKLLVRGMIAALYIFVILSLCYIGYFVILSALAFTQGSM